MKVARSPVRRTSWRRFDLGILGATCALVLAACGGGNDSTPNPTVPPSSLTYSSNPATYTKDSAITANTPSSSGGTVVSYSVAPSLPAGLNLDTGTGVVTGTPTVAIATAVYVVTATNSGGNTTARLAITVKDVSVSMAAGFSHTCAIVNDGVECWGDNSHGQLGNNSTADSLVPVPVTGLASGVQAITAGFFHTCALANGGVQCWGDNSSGQLGNNSTADSLVPVPVTGLASGVQGIAAGADHACALVNGGVHCWGYNGWGQLGNNSSAGCQGTSYLCEGYDGAADSLVPVPVTGLASGVQAIRAGFFYTCALVNGGVQCWGDNSSGQLGNNSTAASHLPVPVTGLASGVQAIAAGDDHACALVGGSVQCWGNNDFGQRGNNSTSCFAYCSASQLANHSMVSSLVPGPVTGLASGVHAITAGSRHTCALVHGGVQCWGHNSFGQLGNDSTTDSLVPGPATGLASGVQAITAGSFHTCALVNDGIQCWGSNGHGQLGNNSTADSLVPVPVNALALQQSAPRFGGQPKT